MTRLLRIALLPTLLLIRFSSTLTFSPSTPIGTNEKASLFLVLCKRKKENQGQERCLEPLYSGTGIASTYSWQEEAFEIEVTVKVPEETRASNIFFTAKPDSIELKLRRPKEDIEVDANAKASASASAKEDIDADVKVESSNDDLLLLDPSRKLRGRVMLDGTYWIIADPEGSSLDEDPHRVVTVTIEKQIRTPKDDFDVIEYDWNGVYEDDEEEVSYRKYDEPEELDVREYAASMGVDIDNIDMNLVDKSMFSSGLNITKSTFDNMQKAGLMTEVTEQTDGSEWIVNEDGDKTPFQSMGQGVSSSEMKSSKSPAPIPFLDTDSPWHKSVPLDQAKNVKDQQQTERATATAAATTTTTSTKTAPAKEAPECNEEIPKDAKNLIDTLTVAKLKDVLRARGLKVSGNKKELQERLRAEIQSMLKSNDEDIE